MIVATPEPETNEIRTLADLMERLGDVPLNRVRFHPAPGTATIDDVERIRAKEGYTCELVDGVLVEKTMGMIESMLAVYLAGLLDNFVRPRNLGIVLGPDGTLQIAANLVRIPDVAYIAWSRFPDGKLPVEPVPLIVPNLAAEILSKGNTLKEIAIKREEYFDSGVELVWEFDPRTRTTYVFTSPTNPVILGVNDTLDGGTVLQGFTLSLRDFFGEMDRHG
ncbi:MAG TPA: Uma2 family endonuclease [Gemmataceae bacterium]|nr:Uma2 family endonuclease [Gemmataceae bacterium]